MNFTKKQTYIVVGHQDTWHILSHLSGTFDPYGFPISMIYEYLCLGDHIPNLTPNPWSCAVIRPVCGNYMKGHAELRSASSVNR